MEDHNCVVVWEANSLGLPDDSCVSCFPTADTEYLTEAT